MSRTTSSGQRIWWAGLTMQEALFAGFCALSIILTRVVLDFHIKVPGHTMFLMIFLLCVGRGCIRRPHAATLIAALVGLISILTGPGKSGFLIFFKMLAPGLVLDLCLIFAPKALHTPWKAGVAGFLAAFARFPVQLVVNLLVGMELAVALPHSALKSVSGALFGLAGGFLAPFVIRRLERSGLLPGRDGTRS